MTQAIVLSFMSGSTSKCASCNVEIGGTIDVYTYGTLFKTEDGHCFRGTDLAVMWPDGYYHAIVKDTSHFQPICFAEQELKFTYKNKLYYGSAEQGDNGLHFVNVESLGNDFNWGSKQLQFLPPPEEQPEPTVCKHIVGRVYSSPRSPDIHWKLCEVNGILHFRNVLTGFIDSCRYVSTDEIDGKYPDDVENPNFV